MLLGRKNNSLESKRYTHKRSFGRRCLSNCIFFFFEKNSTYNQFPFYLKTQQIGSVPVVFSNKEFFLQSYSNAHRFIYMFAFIQENSKIITLVRGCIPCKHHLLPRSKVVIAWFIALKPKRTYREMQMKRSNACAQRGSFSTG